LSYWIIGRSKDIEKFEQQTIRNAYWL
jgi:hypothetical protein